MSVTRNEESGRHFYIEDGRVRFAVVEDCLKKLRRLLKGTINTRLTAQMWMEYHLTLSTGAENRNGALLAHQGRDRREA